MHGSGGWLQVSIYQNGNSEWDMLAYHLCKLSCHIRLTHLTADYGMMHTHNSTDGHHYATSTCKTWLHYFNTSKSDPPTPVHCSTLRRDQEEYRNGRSMPHLSFMCTNIVFFKGLPMVFSSSYCFSAVLYECPTAFNHQTFHTDLINSWKTSHGTSVFDKRFF